jgi:hypothetical protein
VYNETYRYYQYLGFTFQYTSYIMWQFFNIFWGLSQLLPFVLGMRLLLVTRLSNKYSFTKELGAYNKAWWGVAGTYIFVILLCSIVLMCISPDGSDVFSWWSSSGTRRAFSKIFQILTILINFIGTVLVCMGIHWFNFHRKTHRSKKGGCISCLLTYYVIWQSIISVFVLLTGIILNAAVNWLPATIVGMTFMNLPFLSAMSGSDSFCEIFGKTAWFYF